MSKKLGPQIYGQRQQLQFLGGEYSEQRNYSEETARQIDAEIRQLIDEAQLRAQKVLTANRTHLDQLAELLQEKEVIVREEMLALLA
jgi:cell division protease FtsH